MTLFMAAILLVSGVGPRYAVGPKKDVTYVGGVRINVGDNWQNKINANAAGARFIIAAGTHKGVTIRPKAGQEFLGEPGAICDGGNATANFLPSGSAENILLANLVITKYKPASNQGAVNIWPKLRIEDCEVSYSSQFGLVLGTGAAVKRCNLHHNGWGGLHVYRANGAVVEDTEIAFDNYQKSATWDATAKVWQSHNVVYQYLYAHDNEGPGLWADTDNTGWQVRNCYCVNNAGPGIHDELDGISRTLRDASGAYLKSGSVIANNVIGRHRQRSNNWGPVSGIHVFNSEGANVYSNVVSDCDYGIQVKYGNRSWDGRTYYTKNNLIRDNRVSNCGQLGRIEGAQAAAASANNKFQANQYKSTAAAVFFNSSSTRTWAQWQAIPQDADGSLNKPDDPPPPPPPMPTTSVADVKAKIKAYADDPARTATDRNAGLDELAAYALSLKTP